MKKGMKVLTKKEKYFGKKDESFEKKTKTFNMMKSLKEKNNVFF